MSVLALCKFTPLGFETGFRFLACLYGRRVNLPRWGLKQAIFSQTLKTRQRVNLPRWGLKRLFPLR